MLEIKDITKSYLGKKVLDKVTINMDSSSLIGLIGPNGAGKTTLMKILTTQTKIDEGEIIFLGDKIENNRDKIGYVPQHSFLDDDLTVEENLLLTSRLYNIEKDFFEKSTNKMMDLLNVSNYKKYKFKNLSGGTKKKIDIISALIQKPKLLLLDEPTVGLDVESRIDIWRYLHEVHEKSKVGIIVTTHYIEEVEKMCDIIYILSNGKIIAQGKPEELKKGVGKMIVSMEVSNILTKKLFLSSFENYNIISVNKDERKFIFGTDLSLKELNIQLEKIKEIDKSDILSMTIRKTSLEDVLIIYSNI
ncbi:ABC transporter ATP-binding protein [uncultured Parvimonas sp.]|uniref:ABC transporter ATP-binding protein n=1 Tax=uncultured Parvimonas sp. TaxID=747372 RepID=UPI00325FC84E